MIKRLIFIFIITLILLGCRSGPIDPEAAKYKAAPDFFDGLAVAVQIEEQIGLVDDPAAIKRLNEIGFAIAYQANSSRCWYSFNIIDLPQPNALALPGGFIFVTRGLMDLQLSDDELACLVGHELAHIERKHHLRAAKQATKLSLAQIIATLLVIRNSRSSQAAEATMITSGILQNMLTLSYSRELESEADEYGVKYVAQSEYQPKGSVTLLEKLLQHSNEYPGNQGVLFRTHPYLTDRIKEIKVRLPHLPKGPGSPTASRVINQKLVSFRRANQKFFHYQLRKLKKEIVDSERPKEIYQSTRQVLQRNTLQADHLSTLAINIHWQFLQAAIIREEKKSYLMRDYGLLLKKYREIFEDFESSAEIKNLLQAIKTKQEALESEKQRQYTAALKIIDRPSVAISFLEQFVENYPESDRVEEVMFKISDSYEAGGEFDQAAGRYLKLIKRNPQGEWGRRSLDRVQKISLKLTHLNYAYEIYKKYLLPVYRDQAAEHIRNLIKKSKRLAECGQFLKKYPANEFQAPAQQRLTQLAEASYSTGRGYQAVGYLARARENYLRIIKYAPKTDWARRARNQLKLLQNELPLESR